MKKGKRKKYLEFYYKCMKKGLPDEGLCACLGYDDDLLELFNPTNIDREQLRFDNHSFMYWGSGDEEWCPFKFTPLRQTIILFMAAMNREL